ncbi:MAG: lysostaphin resistance A-like protein [Propionibacteriaceae bacterium]
MSESALPVQEREYHEGYRAPKWRWWRGLLILLLAAAICLVAMILLSIIQVMIDMSLGNPLPTSLSDIKLTPTMFLTNNITIACFIPASLIAHRVVSGQPWGYLSSVVGKIRWRWLGSCLAICAPIWLLFTGTEMLLSQQQIDLAVNRATWVLLAGIILTTPLQAAGEEYLIRGVMPRVIGAWIKHRYIGMVAGALISATIFMALHLAADIWLNIFYFSFGLIASLIVWRTGGLEATIAIHVVNNLVSEWSVPFTDISGMFNRSSGVANWTVLFPIFTLLLAAVIIEYLARRMGIARHTKAVVPEPYSFPRA